MFTATAHSKSTMSASQFTTSLTGIDSLGELEAWLDKTNCGWATFFWGEEVVGVWNRQDGIRWTVETDPFGNETGYIEPVVSMERTTRPASVAVTTPQVKVNYAAMTDADLRAYFAEKIQTDTQWLRRAVVAIFERQTMDEQASATTKHHNGQGFNGRHAEIMTNIAQRIVANRRSLSERELAACKKIMPTYLGQLVRIAREKVGRA